MTKKEITTLGYNIIGCAIEVHKHLGPGLLESIYEKCLIEELLLKRFEVKSQLQVPVIYKDINTGGLLKLDILVNNLIILEIKSVEYVLPVHQAQLLSYMKLTQKPKGILINFNTTNISDTAIHLVSDYYKILPE
jgi:GxxExxY protein